MKNCKPRWMKVAIDWVERELTAVIAVAVVLGFIFTQSFAVDPDTQKSIVATTTGSGVISQQVQSAANLWTTGNTIMFGTDITGAADDSAIYGGEPLVNLGRSLYATGNSSITISVNDGTYLLKVTAEKGSVTVAGVKFNFVNYSGITKSVTLSGGQVTINLSAGTKIYSIEAVTSANNDISPDDQTGSTDNATTVIPITSLSILPSTKSITLNTIAPSTFTPLTFVKNSLGAIVPGAPITWTSSDKTIATVDASGVVTPLKAGTVTITASLTGTGLKASTSINVLLPVTAPVVDTTPAGNTVDNFVNNLVGKDTAPTTGGTTDQPQSILDKMFGDKTTDSVTDENVAPETTSGKGLYSEQDKGIDGTGAGNTFQNTLDKFADAQAAKYQSTGTTTLSGAEINAVVNQTQTTTMGKFTAKLKLTFSQVGTDLKTIVAGSTTTLKDGTKVVKDSVFTKIGKWIKSITGGAGATQPGTMGASLGEEELN